MAYKPDIDDARESPALEIMDIIAKKGGQVSYFDPYIPTVTTPGGRTFESIGESQSFNPENSGSILQSADCVVITTNHKVFNAEIIKKHAKLIVDLRNVMKENAGNIYKL